MVNHITRRNRSSCDIQIDNMKYNSMFGQCGWSFPMVIKKGDMARYEMTQGNVANQFYSNILINLRRGFLRHVM